MEYRDRPSEIVDSGRRFVDFGRRTWLDELSVEMGTAYCVVPAAPRMAKVAVLRTAACSALLAERVPDAVAELVTSSVEIPIVLHSTYTWDS